VIIYVNKVGPYSNPQETYHYYSLPVCRPAKVKLKKIISFLKIKYFD
jgi:transmembrane 9 superfamily protein 1